MDKNIRIALILTAIDKASAVTAKVFANAEKHAKAMERAGKAASDMGNKSLMAGGILLAPIAGALKAAADMEKMQVALRTAMGGSAEEGAKAFKVINQFAAKTPYEMGEVMEAFVKLKNMGLNPSNAALEAYGNTASAMGKNLNQMIEAVADAATGEFERLKEFGIRSKSQGDRVSFTFQGVTTTVKKNAKDIEGYLMKIGQTKFAGGMEAQSKTLYGQLSTLKDNATMLASRLGTMLIPRVNALFARITPVIEKMQLWIDKNPELADRIMKVTAAVGLGLLAFGGMMKMVGFVMSGVSTAITVFTKLGGAIRLLGTIISFVGRIFLLNPIGLIVTGIAVAVFLIIKYWTPIKAFFINLWEGTKRVFVATWNWIKSMFFRFHPLGLVISHWKPISGMFVKIWNSVKSVFTNTWEWLTGLGARFFDAGKNIVNSITKGIKAAVMGPINAVKNMVSKIRDHLPFSPAKTGPLKDIHRIKLVETIAASINAKPLLKAFGGVTGQLFGAMNKPMGIPAGAGGGGGQQSIHFNPIINLSGSATQADGEMITSKLKAEFSKMMRDFQQNKARVSF